MKMQDLVEAVKAHAKKRYADGGWDTIVECWEDAEIAERLTNSGAKTEKAAIACFRPLVEVWKERDDEERTLRIHSMSAHKILHGVEHDAVTEPTKCVDCGRETASDEGICYECQTVRHAEGSFDMDGGGWR